MTPHSASPSMSLDIQVADYQKYLQQGGEMGELTRSYDWSSTVIGHPSTWSSSLLTTVSILLKSKFPMFLWWGEDLIQFYNDAYRPSLGNSGKHPTALGQRGEECWPEIWPVIKPLIDQVVSGGESYWSEDQLIPIYRNGKLEDVYWTFSYSKVTDENGFGGVLVICSETTEKVLAQQKMKKTQDILKMAIDSAGLGTWSADLVTDQLTVSERTRLLHGLEPGVNITMQEAFNLIAEEHRTGIAKSITTAVETNTHFEEEYLIYPANGAKPRWIKSNGKPYYDENGKPLTITGSILDITEQKEDEIRKNDFIAMVSHELKTPLTSLSGLIQVLHSMSEKEHDSTKSFMLDKAYQQVKKMTSMINSFLNVSRLESGKIQLHETEFELVGLIEDIIRDIAIIIKSHSIQFNCDKKILLIADRQKIESVIINLLTNAIKYSPNQKKITIQANLADGFAEVRITDYGIGISQPDQEKLFQRFYRAGNNTDQNIAGFGIGLYLSAEIIDRHHGVIGVDSEPGKGSTFYFRLPVKG